MYYVCVGGICNFNMCEILKRWKKEEFIWYKKKKFLLNEMKWNIVVCGLVVDECLRVVDGLLDNYESEFRLEY